MYNGIALLTWLLPSHEPHPKDQDRLFQTAIRLARAFSLASDLLVVRVNDNGIDGMIQLQGQVHAHPTLDPRRSTKFN